MIHCLLVSGITLNDVIRNLLFDIAQEMFNIKLKRKIIHCEWCEGFISTKWQIKGIGYIYGTEFAAHLETDRGEVEVNYIVRDSDMRSKDGKWISLPEGQLSPTFSDN